MLIHGSRRLRIRKSRVRGLRLPCPLPKGKTVTASAPAARGRSSQTRCHARLQACDEFLVGLCPDDAVELRPVGGDQAASSRSAHRRSASDRPFAEGGIRPRPRYPSRVTTIARTVARVTVPALVHVADPLTAIAGRCARGTSARGDRGRRARTAPARRRCAPASADPARAATSPARRTPRPRSPAPRRGAPPAFRVESCRIAEHLVRVPAKLFRRRDGPRAGRGGRGRGRSR